MDLLGSLQMYAELLTHGQNTTRRKKKKESQQLHFKYQEEITKDYYFQIFFLYIWLVCVADSMEHFEIFGSRKHLLYFLKNIFFTSKLK